MVFPNVVLPTVVVIHGIDGSVFQCCGFAGRGIDGHGAAVGGVADHGDAHRGVADLLLLPWCC